jgi:hypothetical protein
MKTNRRFIGKKKTKTVNSSLEKKRKRENENVACVSCNAVSFA